MIVLRKDQIECLQRLFKYPPVESPVTLIKMAMNIKSVVLRKLIFKEESIKLPSNAKYNSIVSTIQATQTKSTSNSNNHPLDKEKKEEKITSDNQSRQSNDTNFPSRINSMNECIRKLEFLTDKYKDKVEAKDLDEFNRIMEFLRKCK